jgi:prephenate dehydrogenase
VKKEFSSNERYKKHYFEENTHLWNAVFMANKESCITEIEQAIRPTDIHKQEFLWGTIKN